MPALALLLLLLGAEPDKPWVRINERDGLKLEVQDVAGTGFENVRVTATTKAAPRVFMKALWGVATDSSASPEVTRREVLEDEEHFRTYYDVVHAPPASDRDYVMHEVWREDRAGIITMDFDTVDVPSKPVTKELIRFPKITGTFTIAPRAEGGSDLTYVVFTDLGGDLPAWLTRGAQREAARKFVLEIRRRAEAEEAKK